MLDVYRHAYVLRLINILRLDYNVLQAYLGESVFEAAARAYVEANPSYNPMVRWYGQHLPIFLKENPPYFSQPELAEIALLERALNDAHDAEDATILQLADLAAIKPDIWDRLRFKPHPSVARLDFGTNAASIWVSLKEKSFIAQPCGYFLGINVLLLLWLLSLWACGQRPSRCPSCPQRYDCASA
jgi:hypothetical protein